jgi:hypothetical protein
MSATRKTESPRRPAQRLSCRSPCTPWTQQVFFQLPYLALLVSDCSTLASDRCFPLDRWCLQEMRRSVEEPHNPKNKFKYLGKCSDDLQQDNSPLFELVKGRSQFHLYVSQAPCKAESNTRCVMSVPHTTSSQHLTPSSSFAYRWRCYDCQPGADTERRIQKRIHGRPKDSIRAYCTGIYYCK